MPPKSCVSLFALLLLLAACTGEDEGTRLHRELTEAQTAMAFCDQAPANCDVAELAKRNAALSSAENNMNTFQKRD